MEPSNPYAVPQAALADKPSLISLPGWTPTYLRVLGGLSFVCLIGTLVLALRVFFIGGSKEAALLREGDVFGVTVVLLGCYLLLRLKRFAEQRFKVNGLGAPVWLVIIFSLSMVASDAFLRDAAFAALSWLTFIYVGIFVLLGGAILWLGIRMLRARNAYPAFKFMAWMNIISGVMHISVVLVLVLPIAVLAALGSTLAMMLVFFRAAAEVQAAD